MLEITGIKFMWYLLGVGVVLIGIISAMRRQMTRTGEQLAQAEPSASRRQHNEVNVFKNTATFFRFGMVVALLLVIFAFNWTTYEREVYIPEIGPDWDEELLVEPPRAPEPPPPPPPPPPPEIVEVEPEEVEEEVVFEDQSVEIDEEIVEAPKPPPPPKPIKEVEPPPPPPAPVVVEKETDEDIIWDIVQEMPRFTGCEDISGTSNEKRKCAEGKMLQFIYKGINYPTIARENGIEGLVVIGFVVEKDGSISGAEILRDIGGGCGAEALRMVNEMPKWIPGFQRAKPVRVKFRMPIKFQLQG